MIAQFRFPFSPSPRPEPPPSLDRAVDKLGAALACMRRSAAMPALYTQDNGALWRWLCLPQGCPANTSEEA